MKKTLVILALLVSPMAFAAINYIDVFPQECTRNQCQTDTAIQDKALWHVQSYANSFGWHDENYYKVIITVYEDDEECYKSIYKVVFKYDADNHRARHLYEPDRINDWIKLKAPWTMTEFVVMCDNMKNMQNAGNCGFQISGGGNTQDW